MSIITHQQLRGTDYWGRRVVVHRWLLLGLIVVWRRTSR